MAYREKMLEGQEVDEKGRFKRMEPKPLTEEDHKYDNEVKLGMPQRLADMRLVYERGSGEDKTEGQKVCRRWMRDDLKSFMAAMERMEERWAEERARLSPEKAKGVDRGTEKAEALIKELLEQMPK